MRPELRAQFEAYAIARWSGLHRLCAMVTSNSAAADDVMQAAFVRLCASWERVTRAEDPDAYVRRIVVNAAIDYARRTPRELLVQELPESTPAVPADIDLRLDLRGFLQGLPVRQRAVIVLRYLEDLTEAQTADALDISVGTVKSHSSRALSALREAMQVTDEGSKDAYQR